VTAVFGKPLGFIRRFRQCERAGISIMIAAAGTVLALSSLFAFDVARAHMAFSRLQTATDAAALAATRDIKSPTLNKDIQQIFDANFPPGYLGSSTADIRMEIVSNAGSVQRLQVAVTIELPSPITAMLRRAGGDFQTISAAAQTERRAFGSELALVINNGDLMHEGNRMRSAREAAQALLNHLYNGQETVPGLYVSVVPFSARVNIGLQHQNWALDPTTLPNGAHAWSDYSPTNWRGCVLARPAPFDQTDDPPAEQGFGPLLWPSSVIGGQPGKGNKTNWSSYYKKGRDGNVWPDNQGDVVEEGPRQSQYGPNLNCPDPITPLSAAYSETYAAVDRMVSWPHGGSFANLGLVWGWRTLSPRWQGEWLHGDLSPVSLDRPSLTSDKVIVLLSDGQNDWIYEHMTAYGRPDWGLLPTDELDDRMLAVCDAIKAEGITIFAVTFGPRVSNSDQAAHTACASPADSHPLFAGPKYFHATSEEDLIAAFVSVGDQLSELRIVQ